MIDMVNLDRTSWSWTVIEHRNLPVENRPELKLCGMHVSVPTTSQFPSHGSRADSKGLNNIDPETSPDKAPRDRHNSCQDQTRRGN